jgi:hypothetical protein
MSNDLSKEIGELRSFVAYLKADADEKKRSEEIEKWTRWVSLSIVFLAVGAALASQQDAGFSGRALRGLNSAAIEQGKATNHWSWYQSVAIKLHLYEFEAERRGIKPRKDRAEKEVGGSRTGTPEAAKKAEKGPQGATSATAGTHVSVDSAARELSREKEAPWTTMEEVIQKKIRKYTKQKKEISEKAKAFERERDRFQEDSMLARRHTKELTLALAVLQVAIALASIALLAKKKPLWFISMGIGVYGVFQTFNGIFLWV